MNWLNVALPKGRLGEKAYVLLKNAGYPCPAMDDPGRKLIFENPEAGVRYFWVKPSDVAIYVDLLQELSVSDESFDVDTLILHDRQANPEELLRAAEEGAKEGSVLVSTTLPADRRWKNLIDLRKEAAK